jgi:3-methyl-2-oxobutanoate hydroxymethyltransferase
VIECVPAVVARAVTEALSIPVIGIGSGGHTSGQVLVYHDLLGLLHHPHHEKHVPSFCKRYARLGGDVSRALDAFKAEVRAGEFPGLTDEYSPYKMSEEEARKFEKLMEIDSAKRKDEAEKLARKLREQDEYEITKLY